MTTSSAAFFSSILNIPNSKIKNPDAGFMGLKSFPRKRQSFTDFYPINSISIAVDQFPSSSSSCNSATISNSLTLDQDNLNGEELSKAESKLGASIRVTVPLKIYHVPKVPEYELKGKVGVLKQYVGVHKEKKISANLPYKIEFVADDLSAARDGKPVKFTAHLREDEFEFLD